MDSIKSTFPAKYVKQPHWISFTLDREENIISLSYHLLLISFDISTRIYKYSSPADSRNPTWKIPVKLWIILSKSNKSHELNIWTLLLFYSITKIIINNMSRLQMWNMFLLNQIVQCRNQTLEMAASHCKLMIYQLNWICQMSDGIFQMTYFRGYIN